MNHLVEFDHVHTYFFTDDGVVKSVNGVSFTIDEGKTVAVVGESGCGKSVTALSLMGLVPTPQGRIVEGKILFEDKNLLELSEEERRSLRGHAMAMIFQEPMTSLNPTLRIGLQMMEVLPASMGKEEKRTIAKKMLEQVEIHDADTVLKSYPFELSGGMRQRVMIAMGLLNRPKLLIADEPTTALDVTVQAQVLELMNRLQKNFGTAILLITHDLGVVAHMADEVVVMYAGRVVERSGVEELFDRPLHPYTQGLLKARPTLGEEQERLFNIEGSVPNPIDLPEACAFYDRCPYKMEKCLEMVPPEIFVEKEHGVSCRLYDEEVQS